MQYILIIANSKAQSFFRTSWSPPSQEINPRLLGIKVLFRYKQSPLVDSRSNEATPSVSTSMTCFKIILPLTSRPTTRNYFLPNSRLNFVCIINLTYIAQYSRSKDDIPWISKQFYFSLFRYFKIDV